MKTSRQSWIYIGAAVTLLAIPGCVTAGRRTSTTRWAADDPQYAQEHDLPSPATLSQRLARSIWDLSDATFQEGKEGVYIGGGSTAHGWTATTGSTGIVRLPTSWSTVRYGVFGMDNGGLGVGGAEAGIRLHAPTRLTPYVGLSGDLGFTSLHSGVARQDSYTNHQYVHKGDRITQSTGLLAIVPEAGVSYWLNPDSRVNAGASYYVADGRPDFLVFGLSLEFLSGHSPNTITNSIPAEGPATADVPGAVLPIAPTTDTSLSQ